MLLIDPRAGSKELYYAEHVKGLDNYYLVGTRQRATPTTLGSGDIAFLGNGPDGTFVSVGIEYKKFGDALQCMTDGRFTGTQLPKLQEDYQQRWLLLEGSWRGNQETGLLEHLWMNKWTHKLQWFEAKVGNRRFTVLEFNSWLMTMQIIGDMRLWMTTDLIASTQFISSLHSWWTNKEYSEHRSHLHPDNSGVPTRLFRKPKTQAEKSRLLVEKASAQLEGIGWGKAQNVAKEFPTLMEMTLAGPENWRKVDGIGKLLSERVVKDIQGA